MRLFTALFKPPTPWLRLVYFLVGEILILGSFATGGGRRLLQAAALYACVYVLPVLITARRRWLPSRKCR